MLRDFGRPILIGVLCIAATLLVPYLVRREFVAYVRRELKGLQNSGQLPAEFQGADLDTVTPPPSSLGIEVPSGLKLRIQFADFIIGFWFIWAPLIMIVCVGTAAFFRKT